MTKPPSSDSYSDFPGDEFGNWLQATPITVTSPPLTLPKQLVMFGEVQSAHVGRKSTLGLLRQRIEAFMTEMQLRYEHMWKFKRRVGHVIFNL